MKKQFLFLTAAALIAVPTIAQEPIEYTNFTDTIFNLNEVVVETTRQRKVSILKLDVPAKFLPVTSSAVDASVLELYGVQDIQNAGKFLPGIRVQTSYGGFQQISARGFDHIPVLIDGMRDERTAIANSYPFMDLSAIESIEYLKGPASVLYGNSAVGGLLNINRKQPVAQKTVYTRLTYGSYNTKQATMGLGGTLTEGVNSYFSVHIADGDGWRDNKNKRFSGYGAIDIKTGKNGLLDIRGGFNRDFYATEIGLPKLVNHDIYHSDGTQAYAKLDMLPGLNRKARYNNESDFLKNNAWNIAATYTYKISDALQIKERFSYFDDDIDYFSTEELNYLTSSEPVYRHYYLNSDHEKHISAWIP
ncbi:MAG: TonB-dependent receptor plug domain-containing protein [Tannerellaceae bacterium]|nr:TonB-dependent receptor plug domain-containing protein [Tannerellaceae bacterium]